jgi:putative ATP-dependent endonuclease of OLD family
VEGDGENILLPEIARLLGRPLENYGVSVIKYDNSGSWKRFARLFLRTDKDGSPEDWNPSKICVLRDLDLWPDCAEEKDDGSNIYGFKKPNSRNQSYWRRNCTDEGQRVTDHIDGLNRQNVAVKISNDWTFEYCLAKYGLFAECCSVLGVDAIEGTEDERATYIQGKVSKTDFAYNMADLLRTQFSDKLQENIDAIEDEQKDNHVEIANVKRKSATDFSLALKEKLPPYIVEAIEYVTTPIVDIVSLEERGNGETA